MRVNAALEAVRWIRVFTLALAFASASPGFAQEERPTPVDAARLLRQATFGATPDLIAHVREIGVEAFLAEQFAAAPTSYPDLPDWPTTRPPTCTGVCQRDNYSMFPLQAHFYQNALHGEDQLRQRVAFALSQILVVSGREVQLSSWVRPYHELLYQRAFGNYRDLLREITVNPAMGNYLDMLNSRCQTRVPAQPTICRNGQAGKPNENYARELLQLFSIGTDLLNQDGTPVLDGASSPIPSYTQETVEEFTRVFTGWILAPVLPGPPEVGGTVPNYREPMRVRVDSLNREDYHDRGPKTLLNGFTLPGGGTAAEELDAAIANLAAHPNVAPFIGKQLIQHLVTSNPSPSYVARVAAVFAAHSDSPAQLQEVVRAILLDPEARGSTPADPAFGQLTEPVLFMTNFLRLFNVASFDRTGPSDGVLNSLNLGNNFQIGSAQMSQDVFNAPSVFNFYPPDAPLPGEPGLLGPQFRLYSSSTALRRVNFVSRMVYQGLAPGGDRRTGTSIDLSPYVAIANDPDALVGALSKLMLQGSMSSSVYDLIVRRIGAIPASTPLQRARDAIYLLASLPSYEVGR
jgi:uncharacterized protein (DUF1800 family)